MSSDESGLWGASALAASADPNAHSVGYGSSLEIARDHHHPEVVELLLARGAVGERN